MHADIEIMCVHGNISIKMVPKCMKTTFYVIEGGKHCLFGRETSKIINKISVEENLQPF